ncbi:WD40 repeat protein [Luteibacter rhizovicinus]|uniref:WD40 repeat protein n=1 Tax=Luteibacter rhizovicinus TaxID=242606 RepID=A0A4R3YU40_9GAMM|nr:PD40 domain-containing protein [Luteibacter rhizovicinus]TCV94683.1 WD40 repeat protein [Luteibacter rhizovicinus]
MRLNTFVLAMSLALVAVSAGAGELLGPGIISTDQQETSATLTPDGNTLFFMRSDFAEKDDTILVSHRSGSRWSAPEVASFSGQWHDSEPALSPDGKRLYFVSNRPLHPGDALMMVEMGGQRFPGTNLWYAEQQPGGRWGEPVHVDGALNDGAMLYNPSVAANGNIYFSAHRDDSGKLYQIYVARRTANGYAAPQMLDLGDIGRNRMDPGVDPEERFLVYAGNEGDSLGSADIYIVFRDADGKWGKPVHLPGEVNSASLENAPAVGRHFGELYVSSNRQEEIRFPKPRDTAASLQGRLQGPLNGSRNIWRFDIADVLRAHGIDH